MIKKMNILFIGGGKMMQAITGGLLARGHAAAQIFAVEPDVATRTTLTSMNIVSYASSDQVADRLADIDILILAVKPQVMREALLPFAGQLRKQLVVSIAAGIRTQELTQWLQHTNIVRAMPNTPALIQAGITGLYASQGVNQSERQTAEMLLSTVGKTIWFDEEAMLDVVTAISGSGPAYVFYAIEALELAALKLGCEAATARTLALETFRGAALLAAQSSESPAQLRANVTSKRGTTEAAIAVFDNDAIKAKILNGVTAAAVRAKELGEEFAAPETSQRK